MAQIFPPWMNHLPLVVGGVALLSAASGVFGFGYWGSPKFTDVGYAPEQPVPYSHRRHVSDLGMDCRYCHNTVEVGARAAIPPAQTCMNCHGVILKEDPQLEPIRTSVATDAPVKWTRVHMLPDFVRFDHSVHVASGVGCVECHGRIDQMKVVRQEKPLSMSWCLDCHRDPASHLRPRDEVTNMTWDKETAKYDPTQDSARSRMPNPPLHCSGCHQ